MNKCYFRSFDVGIGDCCVIRLVKECGEQYVIMVDCGKFTPAVKRYVEGELQSHINLLVATHLAHDALELLAPDSELCTAGMDRAFNLAHVERDKIAALGGGTGCKGRVPYQLSENGKMACAVCCLREEVYCLRSESKVYLGIRSDMMPSLSKNHEVFKIAVFSHCFRKTKNQQLEFLLSC